MTDQPAGFDTLAIHAGAAPDPSTGARITPIYQTTTYVQESVDRYLAKGYSYSRSANPTVRALEDKLALWDAVFSMPADAESDANNKERWQLHTEAQLLEAM